MVMVVVMVMATQQLQKSHLDSDIGFGFPACRAARGGRAGAGAGAGHGSSRGSAAAPGALQGRSLGLPSHALACPHFARRRAAMISHLSVLYPQHFHAHSFSIQLLCVQVWRSLHKLAASNGQAAGAADSAAAPGSSTAAAAATAAAEARALQLQVLPLPSMGVGKSKPSVCTAE